MAGAGCVARALNEYVASLKPNYPSAIDYAVTSIGPSRRPAKIWTWRCGTS